MNRKSVQAGFVPLIVIAVIAVLAIGGGAYYVSKTKEAKEEAKVDASLEAEADAEARGKATLGVNAKGSLRTLLRLGRSVRCIFESTAGNMNSSGTVYIAANGSMRGDFETEVSGKTQSSSMIMKDGYSYVWSGNQGAKMKIPAGVEASADANANAQAEKSVDLDAEVDYSCSDWVVDQSKFTLPSGVNFVDLEAMLKGSGTVQ